MRCLFYVCLLLLFSCFWPTGTYADTRIGIVDGEKLFDEYPSAQEASKKIADAQEELRKEIDETEKVYSEFEKQKKSEAEKLTKQRELQTKIDSKAQETRKMIESLSSKIEDEILQAIRKVSGERGIDVVFDKRAVLVGGTDITQAVSEHLKKKVPLAQKGETLKTIESKISNTKKTD